jgi:hypothetical protein
MKTIKQFLKHVKSADIAERFVSCMFITILTVVACGVLQSIINDMATNYEYHAISEEYGVVIGDSYDNTSMTANFYEEVKLNNGDTVTVGTDGHRLHEDGDEVTVYSDGKHYAYTAFSVALSNVWLLLLVVLVAMLIVSSIILWIQCFKVVGALSALLILVIVI